MNDIHIRDLDLQWKKTWKSNSQGKDKKGL